jgi:ribosomal protein S18 acetylase RimI-like enzyme
MRTGVSLREAKPADAAELVALWSECAAANRSDGIEASAYANLWREPSVEEAEQALELTLSAPGRHMIVASVDDELVGVVVFQIGTLTPLNLTRTLTVLELHVSPRFRRRSVAMTLLSAAEHAGEEHACEVVVAVTPAHAREPNRYLTKLGFGQIATVRAIQASVLRSRLSTRTGASRDTGRLIAMRRTLRRREREGHRFAE